jgi:TolB-like protein
MTLVPGSTFGPYEIRDRLGAGGMGEVFLAWDTRLRREVALKLLSGGEAALREARLAARVDHPNVCAIYEVGESDGRDFIAMQRVTGHTLTGKLPEGEAVAIAIQVADALVAAHAQGVIHRDLKPQNVMITPEGRAIVLDFGIARAADLASEDVTRTAAVSGTPSAMSPEQARGEKVDARTDVFSFGALLYGMLSGRDPFAARTSADAIAAVLGYDPPPLAQVSPELARIVHKCLEKDRDLRYASMREVRIDLERLKRGSESKPRRTAWPLVAAFLVAALAGVALWHPWKQTVALKTLAVLPFRSLGSEESYLGLGIADAVISRVSQDTGLVVRPTSTIRKYATGSASAADAAKELNVDVILEGTWQREGDRLRVTANLLRCSDGASLWSDRFDAASTDLFAIQDKIADQLAGRLESRLATRPAPTGGGTANPQAYEAYSKGLYYYSERGYNTAHRANSDQATRLFADAVRLDPGFALAHAYLAYAYVWTAFFIDQDSTLIERARAELARARELDPRLALVPFVRSQILFSRYSGWRIRDAILQFREAKALDPGIDTEDEGDFALHLGLDKQWREGLERALRQDPLNERLRQTYVHNAYLLVLPDLLKKVQKDLLEEEPDERYWVEVNDVARAVPPIEKEARENPATPGAMIDLAVARAMQGRCGEADSLVRANAGGLGRDRYYHHQTYQIAQVYGRCGNAKEAVRWLDVTVEWGYLAVPVFERDPWLDPIRKSPEITNFLARVRPRWEEARAALLAN